MRLVLVFVMACVALSAQEESQPRPAAPQPDSSRRVLMAKTRDEFEAYQRAAQQPNLRMADANAQDFAVRFPESELRAALFQTLMLKHQSANDAEAALADAERVLLIDPNNVVALVTAANALSERTLPTSQPSQQRLDQAMRFAERGLDILKSESLQPSSDQTARFRGVLMSLAHAALGNVYLLRQDAASAEKHLAAAAGSSPAPSALVLYRLAVAQRLLKRYDEALQTIDKASAAANESHDLLMADRVKQEKNVLAKTAAHP